MKNISDKSEKWFVFSMMAGVAGIMVSGFGSWTAVLGFIVYVVVLFGLIFAEEKGWFKPKEDDYVQPKKKSLSQ